MTLSKDNLNGLLGLLRKRSVYHPLFWIGVVIVYSLWEMIITEEDFFYTLSNNILRLLILGVAVYYNIYVLVPKYLAQKKFYIYLGFLLLLVLIITPLETLLIYLKSSDMPRMQAAILENLNIFFLPNFFILLTSTVGKITLDWYKSLREKKELETETMQSELRFLKSQINPHFLFNTLNSLYALTLKKSDLAPGIVLKLSEMMRYMLYECNERAVDLSKEVNYIQNYLELERLRQGNQTDIRFAVEGNISDQKIAPLVFIPFIENCFKHGLGNQLAKGFVRIRLGVLEDEIDLLVENSKAESMPQSVHPRSGGIGLVNVRRRLDLIYPNQYTLEIDDTPQTYTVHLHLTLVDINQTIPTIQQIRQSNNLSIKHFKK